VELPSAASIGYSAFASTGAATLTVTLGNTAPGTGANMFNGVTSIKSVTVRVPYGATGYDSAWQTSFRGGNSYVNVTLVSY
jgi:hypothetical protein